MAEVIGFERNGKIGKRLSKAMQEKLKSSWDRLLVGQNFRQQEREDVWRSVHDQYLGDPMWSADPNDPTADLIQVNMSFATINVLVPFVADENPQFIVTPYSGDATTENAETLQSFLNRVWQSNEVQGTTHVSASTHDYLLYGDGYGKVGYEVEQKDIFDALGDVVENNVRIAEFSVERLNPWDIWVDPFSDGIQNARWVCQRIMMPMSELKKDDRYRLPRDDAMAGGNVDPQFMSPEDEQRLQDFVGWTTIYEFYDLKENWMLSFLPGGTTAIRYIEHIVCPIVQMENYRIPNSPYHMGELEQISSLQDELNKTRSQMITHRRRNAAKWLVREKALSPEAEEAVKSSKVNDIITVRGQDPFDFLVAPIHAIPLSNDSYAIDAQIRADINDITGVNEYLRGGVPQGVSTATEATIIEGSTNIRTRHKLLQVETFAKRIGQIMLDIMRDVIPTTDFEEMSQFITGREAEKLNRASGQEELETDVLLTPTPEVFEGKYLVEVERGSTELRNPEAKATKLRDMVQMMMSGMPILVEMQIPFNLQRLMEMWLEAEGIDDVDSLFEPSEEQIALQQAQLEQQQGDAQTAQASNGEVVGGRPTRPGQPRAETTQPPEALIDETNSGLLGTQ